MKRNEGTLDRIIRIVLGVILLAVGIGGCVWGCVTGALLWVLIIVGAIALVTGLIGWCGLYALLGWSTCKVAAAPAAGEKPKA